MVLGCLLQPSELVSTPTQVADSWWAWECFRALLPFASCLSSAWSLWLLALSSQWVWINYFFGQVFRVQLSKYLPPGFSVYSRGPHAQASHLCQAPGVYF